MWLRSLTVAVLLGLVTACGGDPAGDGTGPRILDTDTPLPPDVEDVIVRNCAECHGEPTDMFAPMSIVNWEDTQAPAPSNEQLAVFEVMERRIHAEMWPMPPIDRPAMSDADRRVLDDWFDEGASSAE